MCVSVSLSLSMVGTEFKSGHKWGAQISRHTRDIERQKHRAQEAGKLCEFFLWFRPLGS